MCSERSRPGFAVSGPESPEAGQSRGKGYSARSGTSIDRARFRSAQAASVWEDRLSTQDRNRGKAQAGRLGWCWPCTRGQEWADPSPKPADWGADYLWGASGRKVAWVRDGGPHFQDRTDSPPGPPLQGRPAGNNRGALASVPHPVMLERGYRAHSHGFAALSRGGYCQTTRMVTWNPGTQQGCRSPSCFQLSSIK